MVDGGLDANKCQQTTLFGVIEDLLKDAGTNYFDNGRPIPFFENIPSRFLVTTPVYFKKIGKSKFELKKFLWPTITKVTKGTLTVRITHFGGWKFSPFLEFTTKNIINWEKKHTRGFQRCFLQPFCWPRWVLAQQVWENELCRPWKSIIKSLLPYGNEKSGERENQLGGFLKPCK